MLYFINWRGNATFALKCYLNKVFIFILFLYIIIIFWNTCWSLACFWSFLFYLVFFLLQFEPTHISLFVFGLSKLLIVNVSQALCIIITNVTFDGNVWANPECAGKTSMNHTPANQRIYVLLVFIYIFFVIFFCFSLFWHRGHSILQCLPILCAENVVLLVLLVQPLTQSATYCHVLHQLSFVI